MREGISVEIEGSATSKQNITVDYHYYGSELPPQATSHASFGKRFYFDLRLRGLTGGTATVRISHESVEARSRIQHWDNGWVDHSEAVVDSKNGTITARFGVSKLDKTPIVIGI